MKGDGIREIPLLEARCLVLQVLLNEFNLARILRGLGDGRASHRRLGHQGNMRVFVRSKGHHVGSHVMDMRLASLRRNRAATTLENEHTRAADGRERGS